MGSKLQPGAFDCYRAALPDEPMLVLLARDMSAPEMSRLWSEKRRARVLTKLENPNLTPDEREALLDDLRKCTEADTCADEMTAWRRRNEHAPWRDAPGERRLSRTEITETHLEAVRQAAIVAVGVMVGIPSQFQGSISIGRHQARPWRSTLFNGVQHIIEVRALDRFAETLARDLVPDVADMTIGGQIVADVDVLAGDPDAITLAVLTVYDE